MRNINGPIGLCNGTRMIVKICGKHVLQCEIRSGSRIGDVVYIPRMTISPMENTVITGTMERRQFPIKVIID